MIANLKMDAIAGTTQPVGLQKDPILKSSGSVTAVGVVIFGVFPMEALLADMTR